MTTPNTTDTNNGLYKAIVPKYNTYIDILPLELQQHIYRFIFSECLVEFKEKYSRKWLEEYECVACRLMYDTYQSSYPFIPQHVCWVCNRAICDNCIKDALESNNTTMFVNMCMNCKEDYLIYQ